MPAGSDITDEELDRDLSFHNTPFTDRDPRENLSAFTPPNQFQGSSNYHSSQQYLYSAGQDPPTEPPFVAQVLWWQQTAHQDQMLREASQSVQAQGNLGQQYLRQYYQPQLRMQHSGVGTPSQSPGSAYSSPHAGR
jgi:hypothetical protein